MGEKLVAPKYEEQDQRKSITSKIQYLEEKQDNNDHKSQDSVSSQEAGG